MTDNIPNPAAPQDDSPTQLTGDEAIDAVNQAMAILPKKRLGCSRRIAKYCAVLAVLLALFVYWNLLRTPRLRISKETTYITEPLTSDATRVDYFAAFEQEFYPPEMKTDDNGCRLIVRALGGSSDYGYGNEHVDSVNYDAQAATAQVYEKLGLDPAIKPTASLVCPYSHLEDHAKSQGDPRPSGAGLTEPWTLRDFPMMESWLEENGPILDLLGEAVRKPAFCIPLVRHEPEAPLFEAILCYFYEQRVLARSLVIRANYCIAVGDIDRAIDDVITLKRLGRHLQRQSTAVEVLIGIAIEGMADAIGVASNRESQPTDEQLHRLVDELRVIPPPPDMDQFWLAARYHTLDVLQAMAHDKQLLEDEVAMWDDNDAYQPGITTSLPLNWNVIMGLANAYYDDPYGNPAGLPPPQRSWSDIFVGARSRRVADYLGAVLSSGTESATLEAIRRTNCSNNLCRLSLAMRLYEREHGSLPPAFTCNDAGGPLHSWRVLLLPYLGEEELFARIHLDEPWDSEHNRQFHDAMPAGYRCLSASLEPGETAYSVVVGEHTPFQPGKGRSLDDFGMHTVLVVERWKPVCWMDPASELTEAIASEGVKARDKDSDGIGSEHPAIVMAALRNGSSRCIPSDLEPSVLQSLLDGTADSWPQ